MVWAGECKTGSSIWDTEESTEDMKHEVTPSGFCIKWSRQTFPRPFKNARRSTSCVNAAKPAMFKYLVAVACISLADLRYSAYTLPRNSQKPIPHELSKLVNGYTRLNLSVGR